MTVIVAGAGVAGLACAVRLVERGIPVTVLEAHDAPGGRVRTARDADGGALGDLGPSWVWPDHQPALAHWLDELGIETMPQYAHGDAMLERSATRQPERMPLPGQLGQCRPVGGPQRIIDALLARLPADAVRTGIRIAGISVDETTVSVDWPGGGRATAGQLVLAMPLRVIARDLASSAALPAAVVEQFERAPTWMATQAKWLAIYERPFWRDLGLSGRIASAVGPIAEAHDHSGPDGAPAALTGFIGLDAERRAALAREDGPRALDTAVQAQLVRCLGAAAAEPAGLQVQDWALEPLICTELDRREPGGHPDVLSRTVREPLLNGRVHLAVAETATRSPGLLEGALVAGERAAAAVAARLAD